MDLRQLRYFVKIAELGSFSRASELLRIAQPSLSQHIRNLEEELGVDLFTRHARGVTLAPAAQEFYEHARRILVSVERAREVIQCPGTEKPEKVTLGLSTTAARNLFLPLFRSLSAHEPNVILHLIEGMPGRLDEAVKAGRLDVALLYDHKAMEQVVEIEIMVEDFFLMVPARHELAQRRHFHFDELQRTPVVLPGRPHSLRNVIDRVAAQHDVEMTVIDCDSLSAMMKLVIDEGQKAIMPYSAFLEEIGNRKIVAIPIIEPTPSWRMSIVVSGQTCRPRGSAAVARALADVIAEQVRLGKWRARTLECTALEALLT